MKVDWLVLLIALLPLLTSALHLRNNDPSLHQFQHLANDGRDLSTGVSVLCWIFGPTLFILSLTLTYLSQLKTATDHKNLQIAQQQLQQIDAHDRKQVDDSQGNLVYVSGQVVDAGVIDAGTGVTVQGVRVERRVQVSQIRDANGSYEPIWVSSKHNQAAAGPANDPTAWFIQSGDTISKSSKIGHFVLSQELIKMLPCDQVYQPTLQDAVSIARRYGIREQPIIQDNYIYFPRKPLELDSLGTLRLRLLYTPRSTISIIGQSINFTLGPYPLTPPPSPSSSCWSRFCLLCSCLSSLLWPISSLLLLSPRRTPSPILLANQQDRLACTKHSLRVLGYLGLVLSVFLFFYPLINLLKGLPIIGQGAASMLGFRVAVAAAILCLPVWILVLGVAWARDLWGVAGVLLVGAVVLVLVIVIVGVPVGYKGNKVTTTAQHLQIIKNMLKN